PKGTSAPGWDDIISKTSAQRDTEVPFGNDKNDSARRAWDAEVPFGNDKGAGTAAPFILIYQGVLNDGRGLEQAIEAVSHLENIELWLAGEGDLSQELRALAAKFQANSKVKFLGKVPPQDLPALTRQAHAGLNLLKNKGLNYYYSLANKVFDYVQAGIPCLCMDFPEYQKLNAQFDVFHLVGDLETATLVQAIERLRTDEKWYQHLESNCRQASREWVWEKEEKKLMEFYQKLISGDARRMER
ncbi:MAG: glycosyltransferase, partial [Bacteroidota bacterium]